MQAPADGFQASISPYFLIGEREERKRREKGHALLSTLSTLVRATQKYDGDLPRRKKVVEQRMLDRVAQTSAILGGFPSDQVLAATDMKILRSYC